MKNTVLIFVEQRDGKIQTVSFELISESRRLLKDTNFPVKALFVTDKATDAQINDLVLAGAEEVIVLEDPALGQYDTHNYSRAITNFFEKEGRPEIFLVGSTLLGRDLAPRVSSRIRTGLTADATILEFKEQDGRPILYATRPALGGNIFATILCTDHIPQMASIRPGIFEISIFKDNKKNVRIVKPELDGGSKVKILKREKLNVPKQNLDKAKLIFAGGRGVSTQLAQLQELAEIAGGEVAVSRAVVDAQLAPKNQQVGQTGHTVRPVVYVASGISGAIQHIAGMENSELIIAINTDPKALIFDIADVSIIADANKVLPLLAQRLKELRHFMK
jgi:electron transfer flavoprotein alpha subunit